MTDECNLSKSQSSNYPLHWSEQICANVTANLPEEPEAYFPELDSCSCIRDSDVPTHGNGIGCGSWDTDGIWCYVTEDCSLEKSESNKYEGLFWSTEICSAEYNHPENFEAIALSTAIEDYADKDASNLDIMTYAGCGVAAAVAFIWNIKRTFAKNQTDESTFQRFI